MNEIDGVAIDANIISNFIKEFPRDKGTHYALINKISDKFGIVICEVIEQEYKNTCGSQLFNEWLTDGLKVGKIRYVEPELDQKIVNVIHKKYGLPMRKKGRDIWYIKCANVTNIKYILSEDMHLYDPKLKEIIKGEDRIKFMNDRKGGLLKFLEKKLEIIVGPVKFSCNRFIKTS